MIDCPMVHFKLTVHLGQFEIVSKQKQTSQISIKKMWCLYLSHNFLIACDCRVPSLENSLQNSGYWRCLEGAQQSLLSPEILVWETFYTSKILKCSDMKPECFFLFKLQVSVTLKVWIAWQACLMDSTASSFFM